MDSSVVSLVPEVEFPRFKRLGSWRIGLIHLVLGIGLCSLIYLPLIHEFKHLGKCDLVFLAFSSQSGFWISSLILDHYYKWQHHCLYLNGYFDLYKLLSRSASLVFLSVSVMNTVLLMYGGIVFYKFQSKQDMCSNTLWITAPVVIIITTEMLIFSCFLLHYIVRVWKFNEEHPEPDVKRLRCCWAAENSTTVQEIGHREDMDDVADLLQKQADLIQFYKGKIRFLNEKLMSMSQSSTNRIA